MRRRFLVTYDVSDDKRRTRIFKTLRDNGDHVQFSVFFCDLNPRELAALKGRLGNCMHHKQDQVLIVDLGEAAKPLEPGTTLQCLGKPFVVASRVLVV